MGAMGLWYYFRRNVHKRQAVCQHCDVPATLSTYDAQQWFMINFIPLVPCGRKHIIDECSRCSKHYVLSKKDWEKKKAGLLQAALKQMEASPHDLDTALNLHNTYLFCQEKAEGEKMLIFILERFPSDTKAQLYVGSALEYLNRFDDALTCYEKALSLSPDSIDAKRAVANSLIRKKQPVQAKKILDFLDSTTDPNNARIALSLAKAFQNAKKQDEALRYYDLAMSLNTKFKNDRILKMYRENAARAVAGLPPKGLSKSTLAAVAAGLALLLFGIDFIQSHFQTLHVVSGLNTPVSIQIDGGRSVQVLPGKPQALTISEGKHKVAINDGNSQTFEIDVQSTVLFRLFKPPAHVLNINGSALLLWESTVYSNNPGKTGGDFRFHFGTNFETLDHIDYPFKPFPSTISVDSHSSSVTKTRIDFATAGPSQVFLWFADKSRWNDAVKLAEWHIRLHPEDSLMIAYYTAWASKAKHEAKSVAFLKEMCTRRPVQMQIHRAYQHTQNSPKAHAAVIAEYDKLLAADPNSSELQYLCGRLCASAKQSQKYYAAALEKDPQNAFASFGMSHLKSLEGDWNSASKLLNTAYDLMPGEIEIEQALYRARMATGDFEALETELRAAVNQHADEPDATVSLCKVLIAQNKTAEAQALCKSYENRYGRKQEYTMANQRVQTAVLYASRDFEGLNRFATAANGDRLKYQRYIALVSLNRLAEAEQILPLNSPEITDPFHYLTMSIAWNKAGNDANAKAWRERGIELLALGRAEERRAAEILRAPVPPSLDEVVDCSLQNVQMSIVLTVLAQQGSPHGAAYIARARVLNVERDYPYFVIDGVTDTNSR